jgi:holo-[acyl-carrier protein] synthase
MIYGIGTDICDVRRIRASLERHGDRFAAKVLADANWPLARRSARWPERGVRYLATRFSAKEAFSKAIGLGMRMPMTWRRARSPSCPAASPSSCCTARCRPGLRQGPARPPERDRRNRLRRQLLCGALECKSASSARSVMRKQL